MGFDGQHFEVKGRPLKQRLAGVEKRIADLIGMIRAAKRRNNWDTSLLERELKDLQGRKERG